jgi:hypothetical protein
MIYQHQYFQLDTNSKKVFDENNKELRLTGNAFRVLVFLCKNKNANLTEIGEHLDHAKDYDENHLRQYRYKINTIIGKDIIEYKNSVYSLVGDCNTDLLQQNSPKLGAVKKNITFNIYPGIIAAILLLLSFFDWPYGYYTLLRWVVAGVSIYYAYLLYTTHKDKIAWFWGLVIIAILFNPIVPIYLYDKMFWSIIDVVVAVFFIVLIFKLKKK